MNIRSVRNAFTFTFASALVTALPAQTARERVDPPTKSSSTTSSASRSRSTTGKGPLPDPVLLDGSTLPAEKKSEQGMLGDFELPGDDTARTNRVGGQQMPQGANGGQQMPMGLPQAGGGAGGQPPPGQMPQGAQAAAGGAAAPEGQQPPPQQAGGGPGGPSDPNAKAEGAQVGQLQTDPNAAGGEAGAADAQKPQQVSIGDHAMQIKGVANAPGVVGAAVPAGQTQQMEKGVGGGRGSSAVRGGSNAAEKGRAMPAGL